LLGGRPSGCGCGGVEQGQRLPEEVQDDALHLLAAAALRSDGDHSHPQEYAQINGF